MPDRRAFIRNAALASATFAIGSARAEPRDGGTSATPPKPSDVNATEDLMREHGVLRRVLLIYGEGLRRIRAGTPLPADTIKSGAALIQRFIAGYHERLEEEEVFPRLVAVHKLNDLVTVLLAQHRAGAKLTEEILRLSTQDAINSRSRSKQLAVSLKDFIRMYEPHAAREDTVLFPAFHALFTEKEFDTLGDQFEEKEHALLGDGGFEAAVAEVAQLERTLDIYDLAEFTPH
jgi:hemerythrin-like domain-containing protein